VTAERNGIVTAVELASGLASDVTGGAYSVPHAQGSGGQSGLFGEAELPATMVKGPVGPKGGRPQGARNRRTEEWVRYLAGKYESPLETLLKLASKTPKALAEELGLYAYNAGDPVLDSAGHHVLAIGEAFRGQIQALQAALPYLHQKLPQAIEVKGRAAGVLVIGDISQGQENELSIEFANVLENQDVMDLEPMQSDDQQSDADTNTRGNNDVLE
jgi:hypothetical protein